jgi:GTP-binding protein
VDLPGYGYAKVSQTEKQKWGKIIEDYLYQSKELKLVILLVDIRHEPTNDDKIMFKWMKATGRKMVVVATKLDKLTRNQANKNIAVIKSSLSITSEDYFILFSSETKQGKDELWQVIESVCLGR